MIRLARSSFLVLLTIISFSHSTAAEIPSPKLADDPRVADAVKAWEEVVRRFPEDTWARHAKARLGEIR